MGVPAKDVAGLLTACLEEEMTMTNAIEIGRFIGLAIAADVNRLKLPRNWTGLDPQDGDQLMSAGIDPGTPAWDAAEEAAEAAYREIIR